MDIVIHTLSGLAVASVVTAYMQEHRKKIIFTGLIGGALPDIDAFSKWSGFDSTVGDFLGLAHSGNDIYFGKWWYSHHAITHSLLFAVCLSACIYFFFKKISKPYTNALTLTFFSAYMIHLFEDLPTPGSTWEGISFWWPSIHYEGGTGHIWWWNNYDIFLIVLALSVMNFMIQGIVKKYKAHLTTFLFISAVFFVLNQIYTRGYNFDYDGFVVDYKVLEQTSLDIQRQMLGEKVFAIMQKIDRMMPVYF